MSSKVSSNYDYLNQKVSAIKKQIKKVEGQLKISGFKGKSTTSVPSKEKTTIDSMLIKDVKETLHDLKNELNAILIVGRNIKLLDEILKKNAETLNQGGDSE